MAYSSVKLQYIQKAKKLFRLNLFSGYSEWKNTKYEFIAPAKKEYTYQFLWDTAFHAIVLSHFDIAWAKREIKNYLLAQWADGFLPHIIFWGGNIPNLPHWAFIESKISLRPQTSALTQPPAFAIAIETIFKKDKKLDFLREVLPKIARSHRWLLENRDPDNDHLLSIISPNESGMDELPVFQVALGYSGDDSTTLHYVYRKPDLLNKRYNYDSKTILEKDYFNVEEVLFNCVFVEANRSLSRMFEKIGEKIEAEYFTGLAKKCEASILKKFWDQKDKIFYPLYSKNEKKAKVKTIASLMPLFLDGIKGVQLRAVLKHLLNPQEFWTSYPVPTVAADEPYFTPEEIPFYKGKLIWRGPTWVNTNWFLVKGLRKHGYDEIADQIVGKMQKMIEKYGFREYYNPVTGVGYRRDNFGWSTLIVDLL